MSLTDAQYGFVARFILEKPPESPDRPAAQGDDPLAIWQAAKERTDAGISALQVAMKSYRHPDLDNLADKGLNGVTGGNQVAMMRALMTYRSAAEADRAQAADALLKQVETYSSFIQGDRVIALCERNPFGVEVAIRAPLTAALDRIAGIAGR
jgi:hypothetical protein